MKSLTSFSLCVLAPIARPLMACRQFLASKTLAHIPAAVQCHEQLTRKEAVQGVRYPFNSRFHCILSGLRAITWAIFYVHTNGVWYILGWRPISYQPPSICVDFRFLKSRHNTYIDSWPAADRVFRWMVALIMFGIPCLT